MDPVPAGTELVELRPARAVELDMLRSVPVLIGIEPVPVAEGLKIVELRPAVEELKP